MRINAAAALLRRRQDELATDADARRGATVNCAPAQVVETFTEGTYPTAAGSYFACHPVTVGGTEAEGEAVTTTVDEDRTLYVANIGSAVPPEGTDLLATLVDGRWEMRHDG